MRFHLYFLVLKEDSSIIHVHMLQSPPNIVTEKKRREAEGILLDFKKLKSPYSPCKFILGEDDKHFVCTQR